MTTSPPAAAGRRDVRPLLVSAGSALALLVVLALAALGTTGRPTGLDPAILRWVRAQTGDGGAVIAFARDVTALGNNLTLWVVTLLAAGYLAVARRGDALVQLTATAALGGTMTSAIKAIVDRPRPDVVAPLVEVHSASFPSGHAMNSAFVYATLAIVAARAGADARERRYLIAAALLLTAAIGTSRVVLGVHWPSDVLAGWAIGLGWAALAATIAARAGGPVRRR